MSMHNFIIEYAKIRQKEIELEFKAIKAAKQARSKKLEACYCLVLGKLGGLLTRWGRRLICMAKPVDMADSGIHRYYPKKPNREVG